MTRLEHLRQTRPELFNNKTDWDVIRYRCPDDIPKTHNCRQYGDSVIGACSKCWNEEVKAG